MNESICNYIHILKEVFTQRQKANAYYSLRAYARDLKVHPSTLSLILKEKRKLPLKNLKTVTAALNLSPSKENLFKESFYRTKARLDDIKINEEFKDRYLLDEAYHDIIAEWEHYAILSLIETKDFKSQPEFIAKKFGIKYPNPGGGCLLCEKEFAQRLKDLFKIKDYKKVEFRDIELLRLGRHFFIDKSIIIVGRNKEENEKIIEEKPKLKVKVEEV